ncbi:L-aspartate oxidase [Thermogutta sp.]|uniref:L-aspartate oxidase n=1 Tax=Thermogutta sp. TaxID=1962930 RepID=UPI003C7BB026
MGREVESVKVFGIETPEPRYLTPFNPRQIPHFFTDILIVGAGLGGLRAALAVDPRLNVLITCKDGREGSNSWHAQGGIAAVLDPEDDLENHVRDTLEAGGALCDEVVVRSVIYEGPERIRELMAWGAQFDRAGNRLALGREGGHSHSRIVHANGDATGREVVRVLYDRVRQQPNVDVWEDTFTLDLLTWEGRCRGAMVWNHRHGRTLVWAKQTILASGGCGQLYRETTNPETATGDGMAMAFRAGAELRDLEFMQFHPTVLYIAGSARHLITEAMRGEGARLVDRHGHRFMFDYDPRGELAPRDVVSSAIVAQMEKTRHPCVYLDLTHLDAAQIRARFPGITKICEEFRLDLSRDRIPVRPGAHYMMGGVTVDLEGRTTVPGLWAAGEVTSSGLHGANRLASNSLLEALVYGRRAGQGASREALEMPDQYTDLPLANPTTPAPHEPLDLVDIRNSLKSLMWRSMGVRRVGDKVREALEDMERWCSYALLRQFTHPQGWELQNMLTIARLMVRAAIQREESRGCHYRLDFPEPKPDWQNRRITFRRSDS